MTMFQMHGLYSVEWDVKIIMSGERLRMTKALSRQPPGEMPGRPAEI
jgi:hypothetical protein